MKRTRINLENYSGQYEATQTINSLLGMLILPKERLFNSIPQTKLTELDLTNWGNVSSWIENPGQCDHGHAHELTLRQFVRRLRNAAAHFCIKPLESPQHGEVIGFEFSDQNKFKAKIPIEDLHRFVIHLAETLTTSANANPTHAP